MKTTTDNGLRKYRRLSFGLAMLTVLCLTSAVAQTRHNVKDLGITTFWERGRDSEPIA